MEGGNNAQTHRRTDAKDDISATARRISRTDNFNFSIYHFTMSGEVSDKQGNPIDVGDEVVTKMRGGKRQGVAEDIVMSEEEAKEKGVKHPPKVLFTDQHGHHVAHNPEALTNLDKSKE
ncbi:hypothetical protein BT96DRAFT_972095 [Gymnopus androsaceus JB14]|uniref:Hypervirulence associated protein TUDOR domain-containing protein n=1 Tax=Gymnopus androsaceus JB14 TaxID=1447944 RepID=A0A6A4I691_9AGAR|nr:hypothetical protein BT96DRAFT_972095 [Gymnopus androsaceus JB14]